MVTLLELYSFFSRFKCLAYVDSIEKFNVEGLGKVNGSFIKDKSLFFDTYDMFYSKALEHPSNVF